MRSVTVRGVRLLRRLVATVGVAILPAASASGCSSCEAKCAEPLGVIRVTPGIAEVEVCDEAGTCTRQAFGVSGENTWSLSFSVVLPPNDASASLDVRGFKADGTEIVSGQVVAKSKKSDCGCWKSVSVFVSPDGVETVDT